MSIPVPLEDLRRAVEERCEGAYLLTVSDDGRPHAVHVAVRWDGDRLVATAGRTTAANAAARPAAVALVFPLRAADDYSLIVDGAATVEPRGDGRAVCLAPSTAVLHRPAAAPIASSDCGADCVPLLGKGRPGTR